MTYLQTVSKIKSNLTGAQITSILDGLNGQMVYNLAYSTNILIPNFVQLLSWVVLNRKKKIASLPHERQVTLLYYILQNPDRELQAKIYNRLSLDRSYTRNLVSGILDIAKDYEENYIKFLFKTKANSEYEEKLTAVELRLGCNRMHLYPMIKNCKALSELLTDFRTRLLAKYYKLAFMLSSRHAKEARRHLDKQDLLQNFMSAMIKALDRYSAKKGALTSYIRYWIMSIQQSADESHEYGIAYDIPPNQKIQKVKESKNKSLKHNNFSVAIEDLLFEETTIPELVIDASPETIMNNNSNYLRMLYLAKVVDPTGVGRLSLGLDEYFDKSMLKQMKERMLKDGLKVPSSLTQL